MTMTAVTEPTKRTANAIARERVMTLMWRASITQTKLAPVLGMTQSTLSGKLKGKSAFTLDEILVIADMFGVSLDYLVGKTEDPRPVGPNGDLLDVVDPGRIELPTSCLQTRGLAEVIPIRAA